MATEHVAFSPRGCQLFVWLAMAAAIPLLPSRPHSEVSVWSASLRAAVLDDRGATLFNKPFTIAEGLGPSFNAVSCASCHDSPRAGGSGSAEHSMVGWTYTDPGDKLGMPVQRLSIGTNGGIRPILLQTPSRRATPALFGIGLLETVPVETLESHGDPLDGDGDGVSGRLPLRDGCFGRFGWQSTVCDIESFVSGALNNEIGIDALRRVRPEMNRAALESLAEYVRALNPPATPVSDAGAELFDIVACSSCHRAVTGYGTLGGRRFEVRAYTDLLLHEVGGATRHSQQDSRTEFRTPPLWGLSQGRRSYLHDGSAGSVDTAIRRHGGEATRSRELFVALSTADRLRLVQFVTSR